MCVTAMDSLVVYIINIISCVLLYNYGHSADIKIASLFLGFVGQMQIIDYLFWKNLSCTSVNTQITRTAIVFNHLQPVVLIILQYMFGLKLSKASIYIVSIYIVCAIVYSILNFKNINCTTLSEKTKLVNWTWNKEKFSSLFYSLFLLSLIASCSNFENKEFGILFMVSGILTLLMGFLKPNLNESTGRIWCYYTALLPLLILGIVKYKKW